MNKNIFSKIKWISFVSKRFSRIDRKGRSAVTSKLAAAGICFGVMTLIVVISIMNGFQMSFIDAIMEISSYHVQVTEIPEDKEYDFLAYCEDNKNILSANPFYEAQTLMTGLSDKDHAAIIRAVDPDIYFNDEGFYKQIKMRNGFWNLSYKNSIILGNTLAYRLGVKVGDEVNLFVLSGGEDVSLFSSDRVFTVTGTFTTGYSEINQNYAFININDGIEYFGENARKTYGLKISDSNSDMQIVSGLEKNFPELKISSWREYNKSFFGTLKIEKNMLFLLVALIFVVVGINIFNGMRRLVFERRSEIAVLSAIGASSSEIKFIFILRGFRTGLIGSIAGLFLGLLISINSEFVFNAASSIIYYFQYFFTALTNPDNLFFVRENSTYALYASIPARIVLSETIMIVMFGIISPLLASWAASKNILKLTVAEVLHYE
ncbi:MAG: ABC transporter permease [Treponema sp.]|nr:ABC transporter permease [Treponema sp.]